MELLQSTGSDACGRTGCQTAPVTPPPLKTLQWLHTGILMKFICLGLAFKALSVPGLSISLPVLVFFLFLEHAIVPSFSRGFSFHGRFRSSQSPFCYVDQQVNQPCATSQRPHHQSRSISPRRHFVVSSYHEKKSEYRGTGGCSVR